MLHEKIEGDADQREIVNQEKISISIDYVWHDCDSLVNGSNRTFT